ncbi:oligopeptide/dipeptide ABC transporter ATP-binding protein [Amorphus sp. 3PC139-8]|uniref:oligopeptide/dipeptide ABC transporter ATP-binding protein n=1 Tax=Amorphus sp. 3PC139-8 TaxID=2735676 RepID=UPI00345CCD10
MTDRTVPLIELRDVSKSFALRSGSLFEAPRQLHAVSNLSLSIERGSITAIVGESGCGKSTLAKILLGLTDPSSGSILVEGEPIERTDRRAYAARVQPVFQDPISSLNPKKTVEQIVRFPLDAHGIGTGRSRTERVREVLKLVDLPDRVLHAYPSQLSGGQCQRVAIARALAVGPELIVCDEPTSALDVSVQANILNLILDLWERTGVAFVLISHDMAVVEIMAERTAVMYLGRVVETGPTERIFKSPLHPYTQGLLSAVMTPDPNAGLPELAVDGLTPDPISPPSGCAFHPRCPKAFAPCDVERPILGETQGRSVSCHLHVRETEASV